MSACGVIPGVRTTPLAPTRLRALALAAAAAGAAVAQAPLAAGSEGPFAVAGCSDPCVLAVPADYERGQRLPLVVFLHGHGGQPTAWPWTNATAGKGCFVLGVGYGVLAGGGKDGITADRQSVEAMVTFLQHAIAAVDTAYGIDRRRVVLAGFSMGGWGVSFYGLCREAAPLFCAYAILAAGPTTQGDLVDFEVAKGRPVLILNGADDPNLPAAQKGRRLLERAGALVTQEVLAGQGHVPSLESMQPALSKWLAAVLARPRLPPAFAWEDLPLPEPPAASTQLAAWLQGCDALRAGERPVLLLFHSREQGPRGPTAAARASAAADAAAFTWPGACAVPAAARHLRCVRIDVGATTAKANPLVNQGNAPLVVLLGRDRSVAVLRKERLLDEPLALEIRKLLDAEADAAVERAIAQSRPLLEQLRSVHRRADKAKTTLARLRARGGARADDLRAQEQQLLQLGDEADRLVDALARACAGDT